MAKQPYIQLYIGDYIKDTRVLPLNVKGGWVDLFLAMWDNDPQGEIIGTIEDFARVMNCTKEESVLVIQTLKQKKIFGWVDLEDGQTKIISRKQKKMLEISKTRKKVGELGGNPALVNQKKTNMNNLDNQIDKLNTEYEYINESILSNKVFNTKPVFENFNGLPEKYIGATKEQFYTQQKIEATTEQVNSLWNIFKVQKLTGGNYYQSEEKVYDHFINWTKTQKLHNGTGDNKNKLGNKSGGFGILTKALGKDQ